jgi:hypothetical protein
VTTGLQASCKDTEADFWRVVESGDEPVEVLCAAKLDTAAIDSAFPQVLCAPCGACCPSAAAGQSAHHAMQQHS